jgi:hypothetical protein
LPVAGSSETTSVPSFARMLLADGRHRGQSLLTPASVEAMTTNHLTAPQRAGGEMILGRGQGWGYGMSVFTDTIPGQPGQVRLVDWGLRQLVDQRSLERSDDDPADPARVLQRQR